jgi:hypothetical protein
MNQIFPLNSGDSPHFIEIFHNSWSLAANMIPICIRVSLDEILSIIRLNRVKLFIGSIPLKGFDTVFIYVYYYYTAKLKIIW